MGSCKTGAQCVFCFSVFIIAFSIAIVYGLNLMADSQGYNDFASECVISSSSPKDSSLCEYGGHQYDYKATSDDCPSKTLSSEYLGPHACEENNVKSGTSKKCYIDCDSAAFSWEHSSVGYERAFTWVIVCSILLGLSIIMACFCSVHYGLCGAFIKYYRGQSSDQEQLYGQVSRTDFATDTENDTDL